MKTIDTMSLIVRLLAISGFVTLPSICLGADNAHSIDCIQSLTLFCRAIENTNRPLSLSVSANRTITRPERPYDEVRKQLEDNYNEMIKVQGYKMVATFAPTLDDFVAWYYRENKEAALALRKLKDNMLICGEAAVFEQTPLDPNSDVDDHRVFIRNAPCGPDGGQGFVEINHSRELCYLFDKNQWKFPPYSTFGAFTDRDRFLVQVLLRSCDTNDDVAIARLCENKGDSDFHAVITETSRENRPALEFKFYQKRGTAKGPALVSKWVVDKSDMQVVYEAAQYADGAILDSSTAEGFQGSAAFRYPSKVTVYESKPGESSRTIVYEILGVSTNDLSAQMTLYALLKRSMATETAKDGGALGSNQSPRMGSAPNGTKLRE